MTAPKQEKWSFQHKDKLNAGLIVSIGNVFDWYAGTQKAIHPFYFKIRMAWLIRIFLRPEIFKRNIGNQMLFFRHLTLIALRLKNNRHKRYQLITKGMIHNRVIPFLLFEIGVKNKRFCKKFVTCHFMETCSVCIFISKLDSATV